MCVIWPLHQLNCFISSYTSRPNNIKIRPINNPTVASECSSEKKICMSFTLNEKLEITKFSEEGMLTAGIHQEQGFLHKTVSQAVNAKGKFLKKIKSATRVGTLLIESKTAL